jgi:hypothetical protein
MALFSTINHQPSTINHQPSTINHQPSTINHQPSTINHQPSRYLLPLFWISFVMAPKRKKQSCTSTSTDTEPSVPSADRPPARLYQLHRVVTPQELEVLQLLRLHDPLQKHCQVILDFVSRYPLQQIQCNASHHMVQLRDGLMAANPDSVMSRSMCFQVISVRPHASSFISLQVLSDSIM